MQKALEGKTLLCPINLQNSTTTTPPHCWSTCQCNPTRAQVLPLFLADLRCAPKGFKKVDPDRWEFASKGFLRGQMHLLKTLKRRRTPSNLPSQQHSAQLLEGQFGFDREIDQPRRDKSILMAEIVKLRQEQQNTRAHLMAMEARLQSTEQKQQQMMAFLVRALHNTNFLHKLAQQNDRNKELEQAISKKRRRPIYLGSTICDRVTSNGLEWSAPIKNEYGYYEVSELESLALEMQRFGRSSESGEEHEENDEGELTDEFWVELLSEGMSETLASSSEGNEDYDVNVLSEQMGYKSSFGPK